MAGKPNPQNLNPIRTHERAVELGRKGGSKTSAKKQFANLKYCAPSCPYAFGCPFLSVSMADSKKLCALKAKKVTAGGKEVALSQDVIESFKSLLEGGREGLLKEALAVTFKIRLKSANATTEEMHDYVHTIIDLKKAFHPEKEAVGDTNINLNFQEPEWVTRMEAERREKEKNKKLEAIETTAIVKSEL